MAIDQAEAESKGSAQPQRSSARTFNVERRYASVTSGLSDALARLASPEMVTMVLRSAAHAGALAIYNELQTKVPVDKGVLKSSLYRWHDAKRSTDKRQIYLVGPNKQKAGHWANVEFGHYRYNKSIGKGRWSKSKKLTPNRTTSVQGVGHGGQGALEKPVWVSPRPYLRPAWEAQKSTIARVMLRRAGVRIRELLAGKP